MEQGLSVTQFEAFFVCFINASILTYLYPWLGPFVGGFLPRVLGNPNWGDSISLHSKGVGCLLEAF